MKTICFFCGNLNHAGGTERVATSIANALAEKGYNILMLNLWEGDKPFFDLNKKIKSSQLYSQRVSFSKQYLQTILKLRIFLKENKVDTLVVVESMLSLFSLPAKIGLVINHITWEHFNYNVTLGQKGRALSRHLSRLFSNKIVTLTEADKQIWEKKTIGKAEIIAISNPSPYAISEHIPSQMNKTVLAVGRLTYQKGFDLLIQAWKLVKNEPHFSEWKLNIVGEGEDKKLLEQIILDLELSTSVNLFPFSNTLSEYYESSSVYALSSRFEGLGMVLMEAQSFGLPAVSFDCEFGPSEILDHNKSGFLCKPEDVSDLALKLKALMSLSEQEYNGMVSYAKKSVGKFSLDKIIDKWEEIV